MNRIFVLILSFLMLLITGCASTTRTDVARSDRTAPAASAKKAEVDKCEKYLMYGVPSNDGTLLCRMGYALAHDEDFKTPIWVAERLTREQVHVRASRSNSFRADPDLTKGKRAELSDYSNSGYDRGHMAPSADLKWDPTAMKESYYLSNMIPQNPGNNQGIWVNLEEHVRDWAVAREEVIIYTGPIYDNDEAIITLGKNKVGVPDWVYKVIFDPLMSEAIAFLIPNQPLDRKDLPQYIVPVREIETITGMNFLSALPRKEQNRIEKEKAVMWDRK